MQTLLPHLLAEYERTPNWIGPRTEFVEAHVFDPTQMRLYSAPARERMERAVVPFQMSEVIVYRPEVFRLTLLRHQQAAQTFMVVDPPDIIVFQMNLEEYDDEKTCPFKHNSLTGFVNRRLTTQIRACDVREAFSAGADEDNVRVVPVIWANHPNSEWPFDGAHTVMTTVPDYEGMLQANRMLGYAHCFCIRCGLAKIHNVTDNIGVFPVHGQWKMRMFQMFRDNFTTEGQLDGVYMEARAHYRRHDMSLDRMLLNPRRSTVNCKFDVFLAFQVCLNFDKRLWNKYPYARNFSYEAILHTFLTFELWDMRYYSPSYRSTKF
jgi:hypothetical protein